MNETNVVSDISMNDGRWHHLCVAWASRHGTYQMYVDGDLKHVGRDLSTNSVIPANGKFIIGQEQDTFGSSFSQSESFVGKMAYMDVWDRFLSNAEVSYFFGTCEPVHGNIYAWSDFKNHVRGNVRVSRGHGFNVTFFLIDFFFPYN